MTLQLFVEPIAAFFVNRMHASNGPWARELTARVAKRQANDHLWFKTLERLYLITNKLRKIVLLYSSFRSPSENSIYAHWEQCLLVSLAISLDLHSSLQFFLKMKPSPKILALLTYSALGTVTVNSNEHFLNLK